MILLYKRIEKEDDETKERFQKFMTRYATRPSEHESVKECPERAQYMLELAVAKKICLSL